MNRRHFIALGSLLIPEPTRVYSFLWDDEAAYRRSVRDAFRRECIEEWKRIARRPMSAGPTVRDILRDAIERRCFTLGPAQSFAFTVIER